MVIDKTVLTSASMARAQYQTHLEEQKKLKQSFEECKKRKSLENELNDLKAKRKRLAMDAKALEDSANDLSVKAEKKYVISLTIQSNALRAKGKEKFVEMKELDDKIDKHNKDQKASK